mgnify:CR=1 FL=1
MNCHWSLVIGQWSVAGWRIGVIGGRGQYVWPRTTGLLDSLLVRAGGVLFLEASSVTGSASSRRSSFLGQLVQQRSRGAVQVDDLIGAARVALRADDADDLGIVLQRGGSGGDQRRRLRHGCGHWGDGRTNCVQRRWRHFGRHVRRRDRRRRRGDSRRGLRDRARRRVALVHPRLADLVQVLV